MAAASATGEATLPARVRVRSSLLGNLPVLLALAAGIALVYLFQRETAGARMAAATELGRWYGLVGTLLFAFLALYGLRRVVFRAGWGRMGVWYQLHLAGGLIAFALLACHCGNPIRPLPDYGSSMLAGLQIGFWGTFGTGLFGWAYQAWLGRWLRRNEYRPAVLGELEIERARLQQEIEELGKEFAEQTGVFGGELLQEALHRAARYLRLRRAGRLWWFRDWSYWEGLFREAELHGPLAGLPPKAIRLLADLHRVEVLRSYLRQARGWTNYHLALGVLGLQLVAWHVVQVAVWPR